MKANVYPRRIRRRLNSNKATCIKKLLPPFEKPASIEVHKELWGTTALELLFKLGLISEDGFLAGKQYALIKYKRPIGGPATATSNLSEQLTAKTRQKSDWSDCIIHDDLEGIWRQSQAIIDKASLGRIERILIDNSFDEAVKISNSPADIKDFKDTLDQLAGLYKDHDSSKALLSEIA